MNRSSDIAHPPPIRRRFERPPPAVSPSAWRFPVSPDAASIGAQALRHRHRAERDQRLPRHRPGRRHSHPLAAQRNGAGRHHRAADDRRRGTRMRLVEGAGRIRLADAQSARTWRLRRHGHRRQPRRAHVVANAAAGRRQRARAPGRRGGAALERAGRRMRGGKQQGRAQGQRAHRSTTARSRPMPPRSSSTRNRRSRRRISSS